MARRVFETGERQFPWQRNILNGFQSYSDMHERFMSGSFVFAATGGGKFLPPEDFGIAMLPRAYFEHHSRDLLLRDFLDDPQQFSQAVFFAQRCR
jgi:hypothetical protein